MERKFYTDSFEKMLKENADEYKMQPSKKVWHGLYNDLHPGRRWPSATMSIIFLFTLVILGHLNTGKESKMRLESPDLSMSNSSEITAKTVKEVNRANRSRSSQSTTTQADPSEINTSLTAMNTESNTTDATSPQLTVTATNNNTAIENNNTPPISTINNNNGITNKTVTPNSNPVENNRIENNVRVADVSNTTDRVITVTNTPSIAQEDQTPNKTESTKKTESPKKPESAKKPELSEEQKLAILIRQKRKEKISWTYYVAPSLSYRRLMEAITVPNAAGNNTTVMSQSRAMESAVEHRPFAGLELGSSMNYKLSDKLSLKTGLQMNYSGYKIKANHVHPTLATLILNSATTGTPYTISAVSLYGNNTGISEKTLYNYSVQVSVPVGFEYVAGGNDNVKFSLAATFQPSYVVKQQSFVLSTNKQNYMKDKTLMRNWNMSTNLGAFVTFESNSFKWQIGPQIHYQLRSTYSKNYPIQEHLVDYGIRVGVSKLLQ